LAAPGAKKPKRFAAEATALRRHTHRALHDVASDIDGLRFNRAVARIYAFTNAISDAIPIPDGAAQPGLNWALREAIEILVQLFGPMMPHFGEECWARLGCNTLLVDQPWPTVEQVLLVDDTVTIAVQVNGKRRDELKVARDAARQDVEAAALRLENVMRAIGGREIKKIIVVPQRIVNVVA